MKKIVCITDIAASVGKNSYSYYIVTVFRRVFLDILLKGKT